MDDYNVTTGLLDMSEKNYTRRAQIPIRAGRFEYLTEKYKPANDNNPWIMICRGNHFLIYDRATRCCIFDAKYEVRDKTEPISSDEIVAVISEITISVDESRHLIIENDFRVLMHLVTEEL